MRRTDVKAVHTAQEILQHAEVGRSSVAIVEMMHILAWRERYV